MKYAYILTTIIQTITAMVVTNVICLAARLVDTPVCSKPSHPLTAYKFQGFEKNIWEVEWRTNESYQSRKGPFSVVSQIARHRH
jgi:hypothetical protein